jgi:hypothetical protein
MLGFGLHSYGFMDRAFGTLMTFIAGQLVIMAGDDSLETLAGIQARGKQLSARWATPLLARSAAAKGG